MTVSRMTKWTEIQNAWLNKSYWNNSIGPSDTALASAWQRQGCVCACVCFFSLTWSHMAHVYRGRGHSSSCIFANACGRRICTNIHNSSESQGFSVNGTQVEGWWIFGIQLGSCAKPIPHNSCTERVVIAIQFLAEWQLVHVTCHWL
jgi:hypothetical protein